MRIIEGLKKVKANRDKVLDLTAKIVKESARLSTQTSAYGDQVAATKQVQAWQDTIRSVLRDNEQLVNRIHRTNVSTNVSIEIGGTHVVKTIDEWIVRRKEGVGMEAAMYRALTDRGLKEELTKNPDGTTNHVTIIRHYDAKTRDDRLSVITDEISIIDSKLEIVNATTELVE